MDDSREHDEFKRIEYHHEIEKDRLIISQYEEGLAYQRNEIEGRSYELGKLDERLGR